MIIASFADQHRVQNLTPCNQPLSLILSLSKGAKTVLQTACLRGTWCVVREAHHEGEG